MCQILCLYQKVHNLPEISSYAAGLVCITNTKTNAEERIISKSTGQ